MTSKEAAHIVDVAFGVPQAVRRVGEDRTYHECEIREAKDMAIQALEQEPCEDAISREDALMALTGEWTDSTDELIHRFIRRIRTLPSFNPQPKTGHWKQISPARIYECDICGQNVMTDDISAYRYCHGCGAKMVEPQERSEEE